MFGFIENLDSLHQGFWYIAIGSSLFFLIQTILTFIGSDHSTAGTDFSDAMHNDSPFQLFSLRNMINFLLGFGWGGVAFYDSIESKGLLIFVSLLVGTVFVALFFFLIIQILKLTEDNTFHQENLIGKVGEVYLTIPAKMSGKGKIIISLNGTSHELQAMTESEESIPSNHSVRVVYIYDETLIVAKI